MLPIRRRLIHPILIVLWTVCFPEMAYAEEVRPNLYNQLEALQDLLRLVDRYYYEETDNVSLYHGAIAGYLSKLDPHSTYISPKELQDAQEKMWGSFEGIGIYFAVVDNFLTVLSPIEGSPAYRVGLLPGDRIVKIDGRSAVGIKELEVMRKLKGKKGSRVQVTVRREGEEAFLEFEIVRDKIEVPSVPYAFSVAPDVGYVKVNRFSGHTSEELREAVEGLLNEGSTKFILDLRGNAGGYLEQAVAVADQFIEKGRLLVYTEGRHPRSREEHRSEHDPVIPPDMPLVILVNSYSASASEIVAGAVQDYDRGLIVGHTTFGKGLVQKQYPLKNGGAVLLTIARYFTPSDRPIQRPFSEDRTVYLEEAHDDYDPNIDPDTLAAKPIYYTRILHRKVFGSGGITPDVTLQRDSLSVFKRRLLAGRHFLEFVSRQASELAREYSEFGAFFEGYQPGRREVSAFKKYLKEEGVAFKDREFKASTKFIKGEVKRQIAQIRWGRKAEGRVRIYQDSQVVRALAVFDRAEALLASRAYHYNRGRTQAPAPGDSRDRQMR